MIHLYHSNKLQIVPGDTEFEGISVVSISQNKWYIDILWENGKLFVHQHFLLLNKESIPLMPPHKNVDILVNFGIEGQAMAK